jgi:hypothetical protein
MCDRTKRLGYKGVTNLYLTVYYYYYKLYFLLVSLMATLIQAKRIFITLIIPVILITGTYRVSMK